MKTLAQKKREVTRVDLMRRALNNGTASRAQQSAAMDLIRRYEKRIVQLELIAYAEEVD